MAAIRKKCDLNCFNCRKYGEIVGKLKGLDGLDGLDNNKVSLRVEYISTT